MTSGSSAPGLLEFGSSSNPLYSQETWEASGNSISVPSTYNAGVIVAVVGPIGGPSWTASKAVTAGNSLTSLMTPTVDNGFYYVETVASCTTGATEPVFPTAIGNTVSDNTCTWKNVGNRPFVHLVNTSLHGQAGAVSSNREIEFQQGTSRLALKLINFTSDFPFRYESNGGNADVPLINVPANVPFSDTASWNDTTLTAGFWPLASVISKKTPSAGAGGQGWQVTTAGQSAPQWAATTAYSFNQFIVPLAAANGHFFRITDAAGCTSGTPEPTWQTSAGASTNDTAGGGTCHWKESGIAVVFSSRP